MTAGLGLLSEFAPRTGDQVIAINISGLESFLLQDISFIGTPAISTDAFITLALTDVWEATIKHSEFYGLSSLIPGGSILQIVRSHFNLKQTVFLGCTGNSGVYGSVVENIEWKGISVSDSIFADYGQRAELYGEARYWCSVFLDQHWQCPDAAKRFSAPRGSHQECIPRRGSHRWTLERSLSLPATKRSDRTWSTSQGCS